MQVQLVTVGHVLCETIIFADGQRKGPVLGSPAAYTGTVAARLGITTGIVTKVGTDAPTDLIGPLGEAGLDLSGIDSGGGVTTTNQLVYYPDGTKQLKYLKQAGPILFEDIPAEYHQSTAFHLCPLDYEVPLRTVKRIRQLGRIMSVDMGGYGGAHVSRDTYQTKRFPLDVLEELVACFNVIKASDEDVRLIFAGENLTEKAVAERFIRWGADLAIITRGAKGSLLRSRERTAEIGALPGNVVDVTGGGDAYMGGFLAEYIRTRDPWKSALFASAVALCVIERSGGVRAERMPLDKEVRERMSRAGTPQPNGS